LERLVSLAAREPDVHGFVQAAAADGAVVDQVSLLARSVLRDGRGLPPVCADLCRRYGVSESVLTARVWALASLLHIDLPGTESPHDVLELSPGASLQDVKKAFRRLSLLHHPDRNPGDARAAARFLKIKAAYDMLMDPAFQNGALQLQSAAWKESLSNGEMPRRGAGRPGRWKALWPLGFLVLILAVVVALVDVQRRPRVPMRSVEQVVAPRESLPPLSRGDRKDEEVPTAPAGPVSDEQPQAMGIPDSPDAGIWAYGRPRRASGTAGVSPAVLERSAVVAKSRPGATESAPSQDFPGDNPSSETAAGQEPLPAVRTAPAGKAAETSPSEKEEKSLKAEGVPAHPPKKMPAEARARLDPEGRPTKRAGQGGAAPKKAPAPSRGLSTRTAEAAEGGATVDLTSVEKRLERFLAGYTAAYNRRDLQGFLSHFTEDARENERPLSSWIEAYRKSFQAVPSIDYRIRPTAWSLDPDGGLRVRGRFQLTGTFRDGRPVASSGTLTMDLVPRGNSFRVRALSYEFDPS
jgi:ketosteroid isomerase-like protein